MLAHVRLFASVRAQVHLEVLAGEECLAAVRARVVAPVLVLALDMPQQPATVTSLAKHR